MRTVWWGGSVDENERYEIVEMMNEVLTSCSNTMPWFFGQTHVNRNSHDCYSLSYLNLLHIH